MEKTSSINRNVSSARLSDELSKEHNARSMHVRKGDTVMVVRGNFRDIEGKVTRVDCDKDAIYIEGVTREKANGNPISMPIRPSKVMITKLNLDDKWRKNILGRKTFKPRIVADEKLQSKPKIKSTSKKTIKKENNDKE
jgi:ribosomal protein uL24